MGGISFFRASLSAREVQDLKRELDEAKLEIARHHKDFERVRIVLAAAEHKIYWQEQDVFWAARVRMIKHIVREIRNIVG